MHDKTVHLAPTDINHAMQQAALLKFVIRNILILVVKNRVTGEQGVAMVGFATNRITPVGTIHMQGGRK